MKINAFEVASKYVYPSLRRRLVEILYKDYNLTQTKIADLLHITQSAVSRYLRMNRGSFIDISKFQDIDNYLKELAERIIKEKPTEYQIHAELVEIALKMLGKGYLCSIHEDIDPELESSKCRICIDLFG